MFRQEMWVGVVLLAMASTALGQGRRMEGPVETVPVRDNLYQLIMEPAGNVLVSVGADGAFLIDDQFAPQAERLVAAVAELSDEPIRYVLNTHWHSDHSGSNEALAERGYTIVAHENVRTRLANDQFHLFFRAGSRARPESAWPVLTFSDRLTFHLNGDTIEAIHLPVAHTDGDAVFYFREADVLHGGDVVINRGYPLIDIASGGTVAGQIAALDRIMEITGPETIIVPGHGPLADRERIREIRDMLVEARSLVTALIDEGLTLGEIKAAEPLKELDKTWGQGFVRGKAFTTIIWQSETADWSKPDNLTYAE